MQYNETGSNNKVRILTITYVKAELITVVRSIYLVKQIKHNTILYV